MLRRDHSPLPSATIRFRPALLAAYIDWSQAESKSRTDVVWDSDPDQLTTPALKVMPKLSPSSLTKLSACRTILRDSATWLASDSPVLGMKIMNSSPPVRATISDLRVLDSMIQANLCSTASPVGCP